MTRPAPQPVQHTIQDENEKERFKNITLKRAKRDREDRRPPIRGLHKGR